MNIQQLEYIIAIDNFRHFSKAAEASFVTQPTLSMMVQKLEEELGIKIFDRTQLPVQPTPIGVEIIRQARLIVSQVKQVKDFVQEQKGFIQGKLRIGIIPTISPYLLPQLIQTHNSKGIDVEFIIEEASTEQILEKITTDSLDVGIMATPLNNDRFNEIPLYYEQFFAYVSPLESSIYKKKELTTADLDNNKVWVLNEIHCLRGQMLRLCGTKRKRQNLGLLSYEAGSIEALVNIVDKNSGLTIIPEMAIEHLSQAQRENVRPLKDATPVREVSLVTSKEFLREKMLNILAEEVKSSIPKELLSEERKENIIPL